MNTKKTSSDNIRNDFYSMTLLIILLLGMSACTKFVQVDPPSTAITGATVFNNNTSASAAMTSVYDNMIAPSGILTSGGNSIGVLEGLAADELNNYNTAAGQYAQFYSNSLNSNNSDPGWWNEIYQEIHVTNAVLEGLNLSSGVTASMKEQLTGEAKFMRAFLNFYGTNLYGDIPLVTSTNYQVNNVIKRTAQSQIYQQILEDLTDAQANLSDNFLDSYGNTTAERVRPNKGAATALLARVYLYLGQWDSAEAQSTAVINNVTYSLDSNLNSVFLANSTESIWQLMPVVPGYNTWDATIYVLQSPPGGGSFNVALSPYLLGAFEQGDLRKTNWVGVYTADSVNYYYYPYKYKIWENDPNNGAPTEYTVALRLAEQYLIRAEARVEQGNVLGGASDLNVIRTRAGLPNTMATDKTSLLTAILHERQVELFSEWGHRWFDLIRTKNVNAVLGSPGNICQAKGGIWNADWILMPIPLSEILINSNLAQNPGYTN